MILKSKGEAIVVASPAKNQPVVMNKNLENKNSLQNLPFSSR